MHIFFSFSIYISLSLTHTLYPSLSLLEHFKNRNLESHFMGQLFDCEASIKLD